VKLDEVTQERLIPADRIAEASVWITRLHGDDRDSAMESGFRQWLSSSPDTGRAFELATEVWEDSENLRRVVPFAHDVPKRRRLGFSMPAIAVAAGLVFAALTASFWYLQNRDVTTGIGEQRLLALDDGSRIFLNTATRVAVSYTDDTRYIRLKDGEALFDVAKDVRRPFIVEAGDRKVTALGTSFVVRYDAAGTAVTLVEGRVTVTPLVEAATPPGVQGTRRPIVTLAPGQRLTVTDRSANLETPSLDKAIAWRRGQVILEDLPLGKAIEEMNRYNTVKLTVERPEAATLIVNGLFQAGDSMSFANAVSQTYGLRIARRSNEIALLGSPVTP
jgi:transmembrane sensor